MPIVAITTRKCGAVGSLEEISDFVVLVLLRENARIIRDDQPGIFAVELFRRADPCADEDFAPLQPLLLRELHHPRLCWIVRINNSYLIHMLR